MCFYLSSCSKTVLIPLRNITPFNNVENHINSVIKYYRNSWQIP